MNENSQSNRNEDGTAAPRPGGGGTPSRGGERIRKLKASATRGLISIAVFIAVSIIAVQNFSSLQSVPPKIRAILGTGPAATMISAFLIIYSFAAILTTLSRMTTGSGSSGGLTHVAYLTGFYLFYYLTGHLADNFWAVFIAGVTVLGLEAYQVWSWCQEEIRRELEESTGGGPGLQ